MLQSLELTTHGAFPQIELLHLISHTMVYCMTFKMLGFIILPPLFEQQSSFHHEKLFRD